MRSPANTKTIITFKRSRSRKLHKTSIWGSVESSPVVLVRVRDSVILCCVCLSPVVINLVIMSSQGNPINLSVCRRISANPSVCRRLFPADPSDPLVNANDADNQNIDNLYQEEMKAIQQSSQDRWNFDFMTETPLEGNWEWEKVEPEPTEQPRIQAEVVTGRVQSEEDGENHSL